MEKQKRRSRSRQGPDAARSRLAEDPSQTGGETKEDGAVDVLLREWAARHAPGEARLSELENRILGAAGSARKLGGRESSSGRIGSGLRDCDNA